MTNTVIALLVCALAIMSIRARYFRLRCLDLKRELADATEKMEPIRPRHRMAPVTVPMWMDPILVEELGDEDTRP